MSDVANVDVQPETSSDTEKPRSRQRVTPTVAAYGAAVLVGVVGQILHPGFLGSAHLSTVLSLVAVLGIVAAGQTFVIITGGIDLSVSGILAFAEVMTPYWVQGHSSRWPVLLVIVAVAAALGVINAIGITVFAIQPLIMTLGIGPSWTAPFWSSPGAVRQACHPHGWRTRWHATAGSLAC